MVQEYNTRCDICKQLVDTNAKLTGQHSLRLEEYIEYAFFHKDLGEQPQENIIDMIKRMYSVESPPFFISYKPTYINPREGKDNAYLELHLDFCPGCYSEYRNLFSTLLKTLIANRRK